MWPLALGLAAVMAQVAAPEAGAPPPATRGVRVIRPDPVDPAPAPNPAPVQVSGDEASAPTPPPACDRAFASSDLAYADTAEFDQRLRSLLEGAAKSRVIDVAAFAPDAPPAHLQGWLSEVQRTGGKLGRREITCSRGFNLMRLLGKVFHSEPVPLYAPAKDYDVVLWVEKPQGQVRQVQFLRRG